MKKVGYPEKVERNLELLRLRKEGWTINALAAKYGITKAAIYHILTRYNQAGVRYPQGSTERALQRV